MAYQSFVTMGRIKVYTFGPGTLEQFTLRMWTAPSTDGQKIKARLTGIYEVDCGRAQHNVWVQQDADGWLDDGNPDEDATNVLAAWNGHRDAAESLAGQLINYQLEGWHCDCEYLLEGCRSEADES